MKRFFGPLVLLMMLTLCVFHSTAHAGRLSDLIKRPPQLYLPSQLLPRAQAVFTVKAKAGQHVTLMLSTQPSGYSLPDGRALNIGEPVVKEEMLVPETGVATFTIALPDSIGDPGMKRYVEAIVWGQEDLSDAERAEVFNSTVGVAATDNSVEVGVPPSGGETMFLPSGNPAMGNLIRGISALGETTGNDRKKQLIDTGTINTDRQIDRTLNLTPGSAGLGGGLTH